MAQFEQERAAVVAAIRGAGDPDQAVQAATFAHERQYDGWHTLAGDVHDTAAAAGGAALVSALQSGGADVSDYDDSDDDDWVAAQQAPAAQGVQHHTGAMLATALADALLLTSSGGNTTGGSATTASGGGSNATASLTTAGLESAANDLYDQWTGQSGASDYAGQLVGDWTATAWNLGEQTAMGQVTTAVPTASATKTWQTMGDDRVRPTHEDADGQEVNASDPFTVGGEELMYPCDSAGSLAETSGCRCSMEWMFASGALATTADDLAMIDL